MDNWWKRFKILTRKEKDDEIKDVPILIDTIDIDISRKTVTADALAMQKDIIDKISWKGFEFLMELKANQPSSLRYGVKNGLKK